MPRVTVAAVPAERAESVRRELAAREAIDPSMRIRKGDGVVMFPLRADARFDGSPHGARIMEASVDPRPRPRDPRARLGAAAEAAGLPIAAIPSRWERLGDVVIVRIPDAGRDHASAIGRLVGEALRARCVLEDVSGIRGPFRAPDVRVLWGSGTETVHTEDGIRFQLDAARVMFASGNVVERTAIPGRIAEGEVVVDLFAGIGYFAVPIAVRSRAAAVYACEANPVAFPYLVGNARLNRAASLVPLLGDCRDVAPRGVADWVLMGHFDAVRYLDVGVRCLRSEGTLVVHGLVPADEYPEALVSQVLDGIERAGARVDAMRGRKVKSYAPGILHAVVEARATSVPKEFSGVVPSVRPVTR